MAETLGDNPSTAIEARGASDSRSRSIWPRHASVVEQKAGGPNSMMVTAGLVGERFGLGAHRKPMSAWVPDRPATLMPQPQMLSASPRPSTSQTEHRNVVPDRRIRPRQCLHA